MARISRRSYWTNRSSALACGIDSVKVSVEEAGIADEYGIMNLPEMCLFIDGKPGPRPCHDRLRKVALPSRNRDGISKN